MLPCCFLQPVWHHFCVNDVELLHIYSVVPAVLVVVLKIICRVISLELLGRTLKLQLCQRPHPDVKEKRCYRRRVIEANVQRP